MCCCACAARAAGSVDQYKGLIFGLFELEGPVFSFFFFFSLRLWVYYEKRVLWTDTVYDRAIAAVYNVYVYTCDENKDVFLLKKLSRADE